MNGKHYVEVNDTRFLFHPTKTYPSKNAKKQKVSELSIKYLLVHK